MKTFAPWICDARIHRFRDGHAFQFAEIAQRPCLPAALIYYMHIKELAEQLQGTVAALEHAASMAQANLRRVFLICLVATALSATALCAALFVILVR